MVTDWKRTLTYGALGFAATAAAWFALRAYTGVFTVLNLRVFVGAFALIPALFGTVYGFHPDNFKSTTNQLPPPRSVCAAAGAFAAAAILCGEYGASAVTGSPVVWDKFNLIFLVVALVLPFQLPQIFKQG